MDIEIKRSLSFRDSIIFNLPLGYKVDLKPADADIKNEFGRFSYKFETRNDMLICRRNLELNEAAIPEDKFGEFRSFINTVAGKDREIVILTKN
jgi:hypothetical protein